ncbi:uncharacterized protein LOC112558059 isoform X2 [Pomacea canaliculata]|uniref:uncharacterized protein LOC112558059 isoform X2 n=1 Tax=Pomacea canaliculata TaxID=400727 RepID=UPI000D72BD43|nr:uncharacterized protein LOC112558059 isoform X2 [Pomacea canaliculata]
MAVYSSVWLAMAALVMTCVRAELSTAIPEEEALVLDVIKDAPKEAVYFLFDIKGTQLTCDDVNKAFEGYRVIYKFKVVGTQRYFVVLESKPGDRAALRDLVIPQATHVEVFTVEHVGHLFLYQEVSGLQDNEFLRLDDENLFIAEITIREDGMNLSMFKNNFKKFFRAALVANHFDVRAFHFTACLPSKFIVLIRLTAYLIDRLYLEMSNFIGGPYQMEVKTRPIVNI